MDAYFLEPQTMAFQQFKLVKSINQSRGIFDKFIYNPDNNDLLSDVFTVGYFDQSRYINDPDWVGSILEVSTSDGYAVGRIVDGSLIELLSSESGGVEEAPDTGDTYGRQSNAWTILPTASQIAGTIGTPIYQWKTDTLATDPGQGFIKANNSDLSLVTEIYVSATLDTGFDLDNVLKSYYVGDFLTISDFSNTVNTFLAIVTGEAVNNGGWYTLPVSVSYTNGGLLNLDEVSVQSLTMSTRAPALQIDRVLDGLSLAANQQPTGTGEANQIQIEFGAAQGTVNDPAMLSAAGALTFNEAGLYRLKISLVYGRFGGGGSSHLRFRALVNGTQAGQSIGSEIDNSSVEIPFSDEAWLNIPAPGVVITYEIMRDDSGNNSGGVFQPEITAASAPSWNPATCASIRVERWR